MKLGKITIFKDGKCIVMIKDGLFDDWRWGGEFDDLKLAHAFTKEEHCIFTFVDKES